jgi:thiol-disulfide isomerase/thioredoxin
MCRLAVVAALALSMTAPALAQAPAAPPSGAQRTAVDIRLLDGSTLKAQDLRGKVVVKMFWASWSPASLSALATLEQLQGVHQADGLAVVALSIDENERDARLSARAHGHRVPVAMRSDAVFERYGRVESTPAYLLIDRSGVVRERVAGPLEQAKLQAKVAALLAEPAPMKLSER